MKPQDYARGEPRRRRGRKITAPTSYQWWDRMANYMPWWWWKYRRTFITIAFIVFSSGVITLAVEIAS